MNHHSHLYSRIEQDGWIGKQRRDRVIHAVFMYHGLILLEIIRKEIEVNLKQLNFRKSFFIARVILNFTSPFLLSTLFTFISLLSDIYRS